MFHSKYGEIAKMCKESGQPVYITTDGNDELAVMDIRSFKRLQRTLHIREQLLDAARGRSIEAFDRSIDLLVSRLRHKLSDDPRDPSIIKTIRGAGYVFNAQDVQGYTGGSA